MPIFTLIESNCLQCRQAVVHKFSGSLNYLSAETECECELTDAEQAQRQRDAEEMYQIYLDSEPALGDFEKEAA